MSSLLHAFGAEHPHHSPLLPHWFRNNSSRLFVVCVMDSRLSHGVGALVVQAFRAYSPNEVSVVCSKASGRGVSTNDELVTGLEMGGHDGCMEGTGPIQYASPKDTVGHQRGP